ncbi:MAG: membrane protein insertase YidC, partial [Clostridiales bacterium]|nr:membrane protein insertase YidC [Clostridiales bacterium]
MAILIFAIVVKVIMLPFQMKSKRGQMRQTRLQPMIAELQKKHGANKAKLTEETTKLYKEEGANPGAGCIWSLMPLPILLALFYVIRQPLTFMMGVAGEYLEKGSLIFTTLERLGVTREFEGAYAEIHLAQEIGLHWDYFRNLGIEGLRYIDFHLGMFDLSITPQWDFLWNSDIALYGTWLAGFGLFLIPFLSGGMQFVSSAIMRKVSPPPDPEGAGKSMQTMMTMMPLMSVAFGFMFPAALGFYWTIGTVLQIGQDLWLTKRYTRILDAEDEVRNRERNKKEAEIEAKRLESERKKAEGVVEKNPNVSKKKKHKSDRQGQIERAAEWEKKHAPQEEKYEPSRVGNRRYARGRAYDPDRYGAAGAAASGEMAAKKKSRGESGELSDGDKEPAVAGPGNEVTDSDDTAIDPEDIR